VRLEGLAAPGSICVSGTVRDHIGNRLPYTFEDMSEQSVILLNKITSELSLTEIPLSLIPPMSVWGDKDDRSWSVFSTQCDRGPNSHSNAAGKVASATSPLARVSAKDQNSPKPAAHSITG
jgi:hypothetical protein